MIALGVLLLVLAACLIVKKVFLGLVLYLVLAGLVLTAAVAFERWRYRPRVDRARGQWQLTGERFVDPATGKLMEVLYNPETGERDYVEAHQDR